MKIASLSDVAHIGRTMWARGRVELEYLGIVFPEAWYAGWYERIQRGDAVAFAEHAILGWDPEGPDVCSAFQASKSFEGPAGFAVTKEMRREIPRLMKSRGVRRFNTYSLCIDPESAKWFRLLGMEEDLTYRGFKRGPYTLRKFWREA